MRYIVFLLFTMLTLTVFAETITVALAGSSACESFNSGSPELIWGWGEVIGNYFKPEVKILNHAKSGRSSKSFIAERRWDKLLADKPDYILMTLGANDTKGKKNSTDPATEYRDNLRRFAADADKIGAQIIFVTLNTSMVYNKTTNKATFNRHGKPIRTDRLEHCKAIREVAAELNKPCLELFDNQVKEWETMGEEKAAALYRLNKDGKIDPSHTNKAGAEKVALIIMRELAASKSPLAAYVDTEKIKQQ